MDIHSIANKSDLTLRNQQQIQIEQISALAKTLGLTTVAEGVEDQNTLHILSTMDCDSVQGYLLSRPVSLDALYAQLQEKSVG